MTIHASRILQLSCFIAVVMVSNRLHAGQGDAASPGSARPWSCFWVTAWIAEWDGAELEPFEGGEKIAAPRKDGEMHLGGVLPRDEARKVINALKQHKTVSLREVPPRVVLGSLKQMEVSVEHLGKGAKLCIAPVPHTDGQTLDLLVAYPSVQSNGPGKEEKLETVSATLQNGRAVVMSQITAPKVEAAHRFVMILSAEPLEHVPADPTNPSQKVGKVLEKTVLPQLKLDSANLNQALGELELQYLMAPLPKGMEERPNLIFAIQRGMIGNTSQISLDLHDVPMMEALRYVSELSGARFRLEANAVVLLPITSGEDGEMMQRSFKVPADLVARLNPKARDRSVQEALAAEGVDFPEGAEAKMDLDTARLVVKAVPSKLRLVEALVARAENEPLESNASLARCLVIPEVELRNVSLEEALDAIYRKSRAIDPGKKGVKATIKQGKPNGPRISFSVVNATPLEACFYAAKLSGYEVLIEKGSVVLSPETEE